jgi:membrane protease YdiL (CAAX protease family)
MLENELRPFWRNKFRFNWKLGLFLILIVCIPRFILVLNANASGNYGYIGLIMFISAIVPFIFLTKYGRTKIGICRPKNYSWLFIAFALGLLASLILYGIGHLLYAGTFENWYVYIGKSYKIPSVISSHDKTVLFTVMVLTGMTFSPIGEELFFRGIVHSSFAESVGDKKASLVDSTAFAVTHISHFGLVYVGSQWNLYPIPAIIWVLSMFFVSLLFFLCKKRSGSLAGAVIAHAGFNAGMIYCIFFLL